MPFRQRNSQQLRQWRPKIVTLIPLLLFLTVIIAIFMVMGETPATASPDAPGIEESFLKYETVVTYFLQDDLKTDPATFDYTTTNFGLIDIPYDTDRSLEVGGKRHASTMLQWQRFEHKVNMLNKEAPTGTSYKVLFLGRHGDGDHNVAEAFYGTAAWDCYWASLDGNGTVTWADAHLTGTGIAQALSAHDFWSSQIHTRKTPAPQSYYVSPLSRCLATAEYAFSNISLPASRPFKPTIKELLREGIGIHTCDRRSTASTIHASYPTYTLEPGFVEDDPLWVPDLRESTSAHTVRLKRLLDDIFSNDSNTYVSMTSHGGSIAAILRAVGHRDFTLQTGGIIPLLVKGERVGGREPEVRVEPWEPKPTCSGEDHPHN